MGPTRPPSPAHPPRSRRFAGSAPLWLVLLISVTGFPCAIRTAATPAAPAATSTPSTPAAPGTNSPRPVVPIHWAFQPPRPQPVPGRNPRLHPIDAFLQARLAREGFSPSPPASRPTLLRRLCLDLTGLPPSPEEITAFTVDRRPDAYERKVDELLASPHFGERWGRHWLDLARYADSDGYEKDTPRPYAYVYRDWVIRAVNDDLPFDQFTIEQLAGDLLPDATPAQRIATGFHRQTMINKEGGVDQEEFRCKATVDRTHTTGAAWLGLTVGCAECHNHKHDPISQREFFQLYAFFNHASDTDLPLPTPAQAAAHASALETWRKRLAQLDAEATNSLAGSPAGPGDTNSPAGRARAALERHRKAEPRLKADTAMVLRAETRPTHIHVRGDFLQKGEPVEPGTPAFLPPLQARDNSPDRLDLARWIMDPRQPLTARVAVNHAWRHLFGRGLVATENDFGLRGEPPSHPDLLDWLALEFQRLGWSRKQLIRRIVTSDAYRQSSAWRHDLAERDPLNTLVARQGRFRLEAEIVRDVALAASGLLNRRIGGPSFKPELPRDLANLSYANGLKWEPAQGPDRLRRGLYIHFQRTVPFPMLTAFDAPESTATCTRRERSNSPLQALTLLNNEVFVECARALGRRLVEAKEPSGSGTAASPAHRVQLGFLLTTGRSPSRAERQRLERFWNDQLRLFRADPAAARSAAGLAANAATQGRSAESASAQASELATATAVARVLLNLEETITRE